MNDLLKEFEEDMRREKSQAIWKSFGKYVVWMSIAIVLGTALGVSWRYWRTSQNMDRTAELIKGEDLIQMGDFRKAAEVFGELAAKGNQEMYGIAMLSKAHAQDNAGDVQNAQTTYTELAKHTSSAVEPYAALAALSSAPKGSVLPEVKKDEPFYYSREEWRGWQLADKGETAKAVEIFTALLDDGETPQSIRGRVTEALQLLAPESLLPKVAEDKTGDDK